MPLVAGVDSSTQSCKVVVRDADTGELVREGAAPHPDGTEVDPAAWWTALQPAVGGGRRARRRGRRRGRRPAARHGLPRRGRRGGAARAAVERHPLGAGAAADLVAELGGAGRRGPTRSARCRSRRSPSPSCAGSPSTSRRTRRGWPRVCLPHDWLTWRLRGRRRPRRPGHRPGRRVAAPATGRRRRATTGATCSSAALGHDAALPRGARAGRRPPGETRRRARVLGPGHRRQHGRRARPRAPARGRRRVDRHVRRGRPRVATAAGRRPVRHRRRVRRRDRPVPAAGLHAQRRPGARRRRHAARRRPRRARPTSPCRPRRAPAAWCSCPTSRASARPTGRDATGALHGLTLATTTPAHLARAAVEGLLCGLADGLDALEQQGAAVERVLLVGGGARSRGAAPDRPGRARPARCSCRRPASTWPTARRGRPPGCWPAAASRRAGSSPGPSRYEADPMPGGPRALRRGPRPHGVAARCAAPIARYVSKLRRGCRSRVS